MTKFQVAAGRQGLNITLGYSRALPAVVLDEKFQNFVDQLDVELLARHGIVVDETHPALLRVVVDEPAQCVSFYQLNSTGLSPDDWEGLFRFGGGTKSESTDTAGTFGQGWKTWLAITERIEIESHYVDGTGAYTEIEWFAEDGEFVDVDAFHEEGDEGPLSKPRAFDRGHPLDSQTGSVWHCHLFDPSAPRTREVVSADHWHRIEDLAVADFPEAAKRVLYTRYYRWLAKPFVEVELVHVTSDGERTRSVLSPLHLPGVMDPAAFVREGSLQPITSTGSEVWQGPRDFRVNRYVLGVVAADALFAAAKEVDLKIPPEGVRVLVNDRVVFNYRRKIFLSSDDYAIVGEVVADELKPFMNSVHEDFRRIGPAIRRHLKDMVKRLRIAFEKEISGTSLIGGRDDFTSELADFLGDLGIPLASDAELERPVESVAPDAPLAATGDSDQVATIDTLRVTPRHVTQRTPDFRARVRLENQTRQDLPDLRVQFTLAGETLDYDAVPVPEIVVARLPAGGSVRVETEGMDLARYPTLRATRGEHTLRAVLRDADGTPVDLASHSFPFNRVCEGIRVDPPGTVLLRDQEFAFHLALNMLAAPLPLLVQVRRAPHEDFPGTTHVSARTIEARDGGSRTVTFHETIPARFPRGQYRYDVLFLDSDHNLFEKDSVTVRVEELLQAVRLEGQVPRVEIQNVYDVPVRALVSVLALSEEVPAEHLHRETRELSLPPGSTLLRLEEVNPVKLGVDAYTVSVRLRVTHPHELISVDPRFEEKIVASFTRRPEREAPSQLQLKYDPDPGDAVGYYNADQNTIYVNVLHPLFARLDAPGGLREDPWKRGIAIILYYCFKDLIPHEMALEWWDFEAQFRRRVY